MIRRLHNGNTVVEEDSDLGRVRIEWDVRGRKVSEATNLSARAGDPLRFLTDEGRALVNRRRGACLGCPFALSVWRISVECGKCGCPGLELALPETTCPERKWPDDKDPAP